jgi:transcriptional regulator with XRE-family HTH domain
MALVPYVGDRKFPEPIRSTRRPGRASVDCVSENTALRAYMEAEGFLQAELADAVNDHLAAHGHPATVSDRTIRNWLTGTTRWPHTAQRTALEAVFGCPVTQLGFTRPRRSAPAPHEDEPLHCRALLATATVTPAVTAPSRIGSSDIERLNMRFAQIVAADH